MVCVCAVAVGARGATDWPQFRGPGAGGVADGSTLPLRWSTTDNVAWSTEIPGRGWSSPVVWGSRVFVTAAINAGACKAPSNGIHATDYAGGLPEPGQCEEAVITGVRQGG